VAAYPSDGGGKLECFPFGEEFLDVGFYAGAGASPLDRLRAVARAVELSGRMHSLSVICAEVCWVSARTTPCLSPSATELISSRKEPPLAGGSSVKNAAAVCPSLPVPSVYVSFYLSGCSWASMAA